MRLTVKGFLNHGLLGRPSKHAVAYIGIPRILQWTEFTGWIKIFSKEGSRHRGPGGRKSPSGVRGKAPVEGLGDEIPSI